MHVRALFVSALAGALLTSPAGAQTPPPGPFDVTGTTVLLHTVSNLALQDGANPVDAATAMTCKSANGCAIVVQSKLLLEVTEQAGYSYSFKVCAMVDGKLLTPPCLIEASGDMRTPPPPLIGLQRLIGLTQGSHTVQLELVESTPHEHPPPFTGTLNTAAIVYTLYDL